MMRPTADYHREPCPDRIIDDAGGAFGTGAIAGSIYYFLKGMRASPRGERFIGGTQAMRMNAAVTAGKFGVWGGMFSAMDCACVYARQKEDPWNSIFAGAATGGLLSLRQGLGPVAKSSIQCAALLAMIEGFNIALSGLMGKAMHMEILNAHDEMRGVGGKGELSEQVAQSSSSSWFGGLFGGDKEEKIARRKSEEAEEIMRRKSKEAVVESFDAPPAPTFWSK